MMIEDHFLDIEGASGEDVDGAVWRCVNCGRVHDSTIEQNRRTLQEKVLALQGGEQEEQDDEVNLGPGSIIRRAA